MEMNKYNEAEDLLSNLLEICIERYEIWHSISCILISNLYDTYEKKNMREKALSFLQKCISRFHTSLVEASAAAQSGSFDVLYAKYRFGRTLSLCGAHD